MSLIDWVLILGSLTVETVFVGFLFYTVISGTVEANGDKQQPRKPGELRRGDKLPDGSTYDGYFGDWGC